MTARNSLKRLVRARMRKTGESYSSDWLATLGLDTPVMREDTVELLGMDAERGSGVNGDEAWLRGANGRAPHRGPADAVGNLAAADQSAFPATHSLAASPRTPRARSITKASTISAMPMPRIAENRTLPLSRRLSASLFSMPNRRKPSTLMALPESDIRPRTSNTSSVRKDSDMSRSSYVVASASVVAGGSPSVWPPWATGNRLCRW